MFLKSKWNNISIKKKIFIWSTLTIILSFSLLYICIYLFMPKVYEVYRVNKIHNNLDVLKNELAKREDIELNDILDEFSYSSGLDIIMVRKDSNNLIVEIVYSSFRDGIKNPNKIPILYNHVEYDKFGGTGKFQVRPGIDPQEYVYKVINTKGSLTIDESVYVKSLNSIYSMIVHAAVSPENEATASVKLFFPFAIVVIIIIALTISIFYSLLISKPLIKINKVAKKMADLDFDNIIEINSEDEIGELSGSLNLMNKNLKEAFEELEVMNSKLTEEIEMERKLEKERKEFVATISHELKSPITIISGQLEGMIYNIGKYKDRDKYLKESYKVTQNMRELVQEILNLSERENGELKYKFDYINISNLVKHILNELRYFIEEKDLSLEVFIEEDIFIKVDERLMKKVITNIIKNAINYSPREEKIIVKLDKTLLSIENTGVTIEKNEISEVFNAFYRIDKSRNRKTGGTGLGLYIVKTILDKHENISYGIESTENSVIFKMQFK